MTDALVIIPTYNELENISKIVHAVMDLPVDMHLLIVDDGSPDGTADIVKQLMQDKFNGRLHIVQREGKLGLGTAYIRGFEWAIQKGYDFIFEMDADFSHDPTDLPRLYEAAKKPGAGMSVGSRYIKGGKLVNWPLKRILISRGASVYVRLITWMPVNDPTAGFVCYRREALEKLDFTKIHFIGYAFQIEMKFNIWKAGYKIEEVPITFKDRVEGISKMSAKIFKEAFFGVLLIKWNSIMGKTAVRKQA